MMISPRGHTLNDQKPSDPNWCDLPCCPDTPWLLGKDHCGEIENGTRARDGFLPTTTTERMIGACGRKANPNELLYFE